MRTLNTKVVDAAANATGNSSAVDAALFYSASVIGVFSDVATTGTLKVQASNDFTDAGNVADNFVPTNWVDIPLATVAVTAGGVVLVPMPLNFSFRWLRAVWTRTAGAGTYTVLLNSQGF